MNDICSRNRAFFLLLVFCFRFELTGFKWFDQQNENILDCAFFEIDSKQLIGVTMLNVGDVVNIVNWTSSCFCNT